MALVVESTSSNTVSNADSVTVTKPTGTSEGDVLLLIASGVGLTLPSSSGFTLSVSKTQDNSGGLADTSLACFYKIAGASEPSDYTVNLSGTESSGSAVIYRISGWNEGDPVFDSSTTGGTHDASSGSLGASSLTISRPTASVVIQAWMHQSEDNFTSMSNYSITTSGTNPSWTEVLDDDYSINSGVGDAQCSFASAYSTDANTSDITAFNADFSSATTGDPDAYAGLLLVIVEPVSDTANVSHLAITPTVESLTGVNSASATIDHIEIAPTLKSLTTKSSSDKTQWTKQSKNSTTWTKQSKS